ncbi:MAG: aspartate kinase [Nanoarchaeota archaeon]|nr:aspartate kinase [Nanoarchaeota archaeon]
MPIVVMKFGGTSVGNANRIRTVADIVKTRIDPKKEASKSGLPVVVVSAVTGMTDLLIKAGQEALKKNLIMDQITDIHLKILEDLNLTEKVIEKDLENLGKHLKKIADKGDLDRQELDELMSFGERMSSKIVAAHLNSVGIDAKAESSYDVGFVTNSNYGEAEILDQTYDNLAHSLKKRKEVVVITGFIAKDLHGKITSLGRGGSDYTAAILGAALNVDEIEIWTDVDGIMTCDPRLVPNAKSIGVISFAEATELAYFGAKVLHPKTILPAMRKRIPVRVLNTHNPTHPGTLIISDEEKIEGIIKAIAFKRNVTLINITSTRMLYTHGFLSKVFEVFDRYKVSVDLVATSEVTVSITPNTAHHIAEIKKDLSRVAHVDVEEGRAMISVVGKGLQDTPGISSRIYKALGNAHVNVEVISQSYGINQSVIVDGKDLERGVKAIHAEFFE